VILPDVILFSNSSIKSSNSSTGTSSIFPSTVLAAFSSTSASDNLVIGLGGVILLDFIE